LWPPGIWRTYVDNPSFGLPGTGLMRIDPKIAATVRRATHGLRKHCDTFYGVPNQNSFHIFSGIPALTGMVANGGPEGLTSSQQDQVVKALQAKTRAHKRVCILRDTSQVVVLPRGRLTHLLAKYSKVVAKAGPYTISKH
jgi:hypothetical protein